MKRTQSLTLTAVERDGQWIAYAVREDNGDRFGIECAAASEPDAIGLLTEWLEWQHEHASALEALQRAERDYHRTIAGSAFASPRAGTAEGIARGGGGGARPSRRRQSKEASMTCG